MACSKHCSYRHVAKTVWKVRTITENNIQEHKIGVFTVKKFLLEIIYHVICLHF